MANNCQPIEGDSEGRFSVKVTIRCPGKPAGQPEQKVEKTILVDSGGFTVIEKDNLKAFVGKTEMAPGPIIGTNFGPIQQLLGLTMDVEVEDYGGGGKETRHCTDVAWGETKDEKNNGKFGKGTEGVLGAKQMKNLKADPGHLADGAPYLCKWPKPVPGAVPADTGTGESPNKPGQK
jgi:hypothetical protein